MIRHSISFMAFIDLACAKVLLFRTNESASHLPLPNPSGWRKNPKIGISKGMLVGPVLGSRLRFTP